MSLHAIGGKTVVPATIFLSFLSFNKKGWSTMKWTDIIPECGENINLKAYWFMFGFEFSLFKSWFGLGVVVCVQA
jgi:hypothetical protein